MTSAKANLSRAERMEKALRDALAPRDFALSDESGKHAGHAGARPGGETHYALRIVSTRFDGLARVARQRLVYQTLRAEFAEGLHALSLDLKTPQEVGGRS